MIATFAAKLPVIPAGHDTAAKVTAMLGVTVIADIAVEPGVADAGAALKVNPGLTVNAIVPFAVSTPLVPATDNE